MRARTKIVGSSSLRLRRHPNQSPNDCFWRRAAIRNFGEQLLELTQRMNNEFASTIAAVSLTAVRRRDKNRQYDVQPHPTATSARRCPHTSTKRKTAGHFSGSSASQSGRSSVQQLHLMPGQIAFTKHFGSELLGERPREAQDSGLGCRIGMPADGAGHAARQRIDR